VNAVVRPLMVFPTFPLTIVTLGLFLFVINALMLLLVSALVPGMRVQGFGPALVGSFLLTVLNILIAFFLGI
jgi:putative membrane protein